MIMNSTRKLVSLTKVVSRQLHKSKPLNFTEEAVAAKRAKLLKIQERYQIADGTPSYLKGGLTDRLLVGLTCGLIVIGLGMSGDTIYQLLSKN